MRKILFILALTLSTALSASDLTVKVDYHDVVRPADMSPMPTVFVDEHLIASVQLDVYVVPELRSSSRFYDELRALTPDSWLQAVRWSLTDSEGRDVTLPAPVLLRSTVRERGPNAAQASDRDMTVPCTTYKARLDFGPLAPGDYTLSASVHDLRRTFPVSIRTGQESDVREKFLEVKASRASTYAEFRELQLERHHVNPSRLDPVLEVIDRALLESTLADTQELLALVISKMEQRLASANAPEKAAFFAQRLRELRDTERALPEYFGRRNDWKMIRDSVRGNYVIKNRKTDAVVKDFGLKPAN